MPYRRPGSPSRTLRASVSIVCLTLLAACEQPADTAAEEASATAASAVAPEAPSSAEGKVSYSAGYQIAEQFAGQFGAGFDGSAFQAGVKDAVAGTERRVSEVDFATARGELVERRRIEAEAAAASNEAEAQTFLAENGARPEVTTTASGLQYEVMVAGEGDMPDGPTARVVTHYTGRLLDGSVFDSSEARGQPATFGLDQVIPGWTEALQLMTVGSRWKIWLPPELAYGPRPPSPDIPPNALLEFEVELLEIATDG